jgi:hypothetical protein
MAFTAADVETVLHAVVCQFGDYQQPTVDNFDAFQRQQERMSHGTHVVKRSQLVRRTLFVLLAKDELDRFGQAAGRFGAPNLAVAAGAQALEQPVAGKRFEIDVNIVIHVVDPNWRLSG